MSYSRPYSSYGSFGSIRGRSLNAYERARPNTNSRDLYEGLNKESTEVISKPTLAYRAPEPDIQPKDLIYLGSYNWIEATVPSIIVPGEFGSPATLSTTPPHFFSTSRPSSPLTRRTERMGRQTPPANRRVGSRLRLHRPKWSPDGFPYPLPAHSGSPRRRIPIRDRRRGQIRLVFRRLRHGSKRFEKALEVDQRCDRRSA